MPVLRLASTEGVFGGWTDERQRALFEAIIGQSSILSGSWCCSSWYKPSGSFNYAVPRSTQLLPAGCGKVGAPAGGAASRDAPAELKQQCAAARAQRLLSQLPFEFYYVLAHGKDGRDGYFRLLSPAEGDRHDL